MDIQKLTIKSAKRALESKEFSCVDLVSAVFERIREHDGNVKAFLTLCESEAMREAEQVDAKISRNESLRVLEGIPIAVKDVIATKGVRTTAASKILEQYIPPYDATIVRKLKDAGAIIIGKTNCDEFAHGASTENSAFGPSHNPWDLSRSPGGSSGGSAAALSAGFCIAALGTDTGGSTRQPGGWCNLYGLRPTYGRISRYGLISMTSSTDTPGIFAKTAEDTALLLSVLAGQDKMDATTLPAKMDDYASHLERSLKGIKIGLPKEFFEHTEDPESAEVISQAIAKLEELGAQIKHVSLPHTKYGVSVYYIITPSEVSSNLGRFDGIRYGHRSQDASNLFETYTKTRGQNFGSESKRRIMLGTYALSSGYYDAYYKKAQKVRTVITKEVEKVLNDVDLLITPVSPHVAIKLGEKNDDPLAMYLEDIYMSTAALSGVPGLSIPAGFAHNMPVGLQIMGKQLDEASVLSVAHQYEKATDWTEKFPLL
ncbi:MAG: Asp-tRNA(Asn)/Glu-tRNA(Gln) amidotransferase GatCAB subunit A [Parcubacteria group bacterium CG11_big_fil_rev_8_21_14_0_20_41_14]|nr:MAG: Asp-tRNA(Asn)/Glu-tRNA(Gln) amidotransferase GatCAB subunit A [Parcubacteria group bacterium CG11_big_fil_rev_8_21_14_0_20_41_14]PIR56904.1 MAG: Asp-tRNA(Asn)/Glu-tRNA(Gln) amidotransferase GatCAB subunit A [Parcubacteria group bacterium CG10_big_fil_rev_8_21_14_0_10_41_35]